MGQVIYKIILSLQIENTILKKTLLLFVHFSLFILSVSCTNSLGKKGKWNEIYKQEFISNCKSEIRKEESLLKLDSLTISTICDCVAFEAEAEFAPLKMEEERSQSQMKIISTDCARDILMEKLNKN